MMTKKGEKNDDSALYIITFSIKFLMAFISIGLVSINLTLFQLRTRIRISVSHSLKTQCQYEMSLQNIDISVLSMKMFQQILDEKIVCETRPQCVNGKY